jgi:hypothetical protein
MTSADKDWLLRELDGIKKSVDSVDEKVDDVRERVTRLEASSRTISWLIGSLIAGTPVLFLIFDRITH